MTDDSLENIDISSLMGSYNDSGSKDLKELFEQKLKELKINQTQALDIMQIQSRALIAILEGTSTRLDLLALVKLSQFLDIPQGEVIRIFLDSLKNPNLSKIKDIDRRKFILKNFDINELKKEGILN